MSQIIAHVYLFVADAGIHFDGTLGLGFDYLSGNKRLRRNVLALHPWTQPHDSNHASTYSLSLCSDHFTSLMFNVRDMAASSVPPHDNRMSKCLSTHRSISECSSFVTDALQTAGFDVINPSLHIHSFLSYDAPNLSSCGPGAKESDRLDCVLRSDPLLLIDI